MLDAQNVEWKVLHDPSHAVLKQEITNFMRDIIEVTRCVPRIEGVFRKDRQAVIDKMWVKRLEEEAAGGGGGGAFGGGRTDINYQNMSEEEKAEKWKNNWELKPFTSEYEYFDKVHGSKDIKQISA